LQQLRQDELEDEHRPERRSARRLLTSIPPLACVECGGKIAEVLARLGSTRCHDCRGGVPASALMGPAGPGTITPSPGPRA
jgi:hypothetical protein